MRIIDSFKQSVVKYKDKTALVDSSNTRFMTYAQLDEFSVISDLFCPQMHGRLCPLIIGIYAGSFRTRHDELCHMNSPSRTICTAWSSIRRRRF